MKQLTAEEKELLQLQKRLTTRFNKACAEYGLIADGDKILVGLSGGKDSLALVELLGRRQKIYVPHFSVVAAHITIDEIGYQSDLEYLRQFCQNHGVEFLHINTHISPISPSEQKDETAKHVNTKQKNHCFLCSWYRRKALFDAAKQLNCNKIALGHHKDDIVQTLLMNLVYQGSFSTIPPQLRMQKFPMTLIRPLCLIKEADLLRYAQLSNYKKMPKLCPYEKESSRADIKQLVKTLEQLNPNILDSVWGAMENIKTDYLPAKI